jgi:hypothetical protein
MAAVTTRVECYSESSEAAASGTVTASPIASGNKRVLTITSFLRITQTSRTKVWGIPPHRGHAQLGFHAPHCIGNTTINLPGMSFNESQRLMHFHDASVHIHRLPQVGCHVANLRNTPTLSLIP